MTNTEIAELVLKAADYGTTVVVLDRHLTPWILFEAEDGEIYAHTVPTDDPEDKPSVHLDGLCDANPELRVIWDGRS